MNAEGITIGVVEDEAGLARLQQPWTRLLRQSAGDTIFLTWEWATAWWRSYGAGKRLWILQVERDGELIGLLPLYRGPVVLYRVFSYRGLYFLGDGSWDSEYLDLIAKSGEEEVIARAVVAFLLEHRGDWDLLFLHEVPVSSVSLPCLRRLFQEAGCYWRQTEVPCATVALPGNWEDYLKRLKPRMRTKVRSLIRELEARCTVRFDSCRKEDDLPTRLESLFELHNMRWSHEGRRGVFESRDKRRFYQEMASLFLARGWLRFYSLTVDGAYVAHQFCFEYGNRMFLLQEGFDPHRTEAGVGNVLRAYVFRDGIERKVEVYDFLGGVTSHKLSWGGEVKHSLRAAVGRPGWKTKAYFVLPRAMELAKRGVKALLPSGILRWARSLRTGRESPVGQGDQG